MTTLREKVGYTIYLTSELELQTKTYVHICSMSGYTDIPYLRIIYDLVFVPSSLFLEIGSFVVVENQTDPGTFGIFIGAEALRIMIPV